MSKSLKNLASIVLVIMLLVSCICVGTVTTSAAPGGTTVYFKNTDNWSEVYCYSWVDGGDNDGAWPGNAMTDEGNGIFSYVSKNACDKVIFNNNSGEQTRNLTYPDGEYNYYDCSAKIWVNAAGEEKPTEEETTSPQGSKFASVGLIGQIDGVTDWGNEKYELTYADGVWSVEIEFKGGANQFKARANDSWDISFGDGSSDYKKTLNGTYVISIEDGAANGTSLTVTAKSEPTDPTSPTSTEPTDPTSTDPTQPASTTTLYLVPNDNWNQSGARFAAYFFGNSPEDWESMTAVEGETNLYSVAVPEGDWTAVIFCRMNPNAADNNWNNKWNQSADLKFAEMTGNCFTVDEGLWGGSNDGATGTWSTYQKEDPTDPTVPTYTVTIKKNGEESTQEIEEGGVAVANAPVVEGKTFQYWTDENGKIITYSRSYGFYVYSDRTLIAVYADKAAEKQPTINVTSQIAYSKNGKNYIAFGVSRDVPGTYKVVEHGVLYGTSLSLFVNGDADANLKLDDNNQPMSKVKQYKATSTSLRGLVRLNASVGTYKDMVVCARGYMIIQNKSTGEQSVIYSDVAKGSFNNPVQ